MGASATDNHRHFMLRAIDLAARATGFASPNPMVGCVLVKDGRIVGEGFHAKPHTPHAETMALRDAGEEARGATAFVTLEPCNHYGSNPPCTKGLIEAGVAEVFFAVADPNPVAAGGTEALQAAGIQVSSGLCAEEAEDLNRFWLHRMRTARPFVVGKFAASLDGKIATHAGDSKWITGEAARQRGHDLRHACDAIIVGIETVIADDPALTARPAGSVGQRRVRHPLRVILDSSGRLPMDAAMLRSTTPGRTLVATTDRMPALKEQALRGRGVDILRLPADQAGRPELTALLQALAGRDCISCLVEGGGTVLGSFFDQSLVNEVFAFIAPVIIGGDGPSPVGGIGARALNEAFRLQNTTLEQLGDDLLLRARVSAPQMEATCSQAS